MNYNNENEFLSLAIKLGEEILKKTEITECGLAWKKSSFEYPDRKIMDYSTDLYAGISGISFFFHELYLYTKDDRYLEVTKESANWVIQHCKQNPTINYAFYTGKLGVCWLLAQIYKSTGEQYFLKQALELALSCAEDFLSPDQITDNGYFEGRAGSLLALLQLYYILQEEEILRYINMFIDKLVRDIRIGPAGISWVSNKNHIKPLLSCGYGNSGIAFVFLELGKYFNNPSFFWIAEQAIAYENSNYRKDLTNWPDYRKEIITAEDLKKFRYEFENSNIDFFLMPGDKLSLADGIVGIGLTRFSAYEIVKKTCYYDDIHHVLSKLEPDINNHTESFENRLELAIFYYQAYQKLKQYSFFEEASIIVKENSGKYLNHDIDCSLFKGKSGLAYLALLLSQNGSKSSIFMPSINQKCSNKINQEKYPMIFLKKEELIKTCLRTRFYRTLALIEKICPQSFQAFLISINDPVVLIDAEKFKEFISRQNNEILNDCFGFEYEKYLLEMDIKSNILLHMEEVINIENMQYLYNLPENQFIKTKLKLNPYARIVRSGWDWISIIDKQTNKPIHFSDNLQKEKGEFFNLIIPVSEANTVYEKSLSEVANLLVEDLREPKSIKKIVDEFLEAFEIESNDEIPVIKKLAMDYIDRFVEEGILVIDI